MKKVVFLSVLVLFVFASFASAYVVHEETRQLKDEEIVNFGPQDNSAVFVVDDDNPIIRQSPGEEVGITFHDQQHNTSLGHQVAASPTGEVHVAWMHSQNETHDPRRIKYRYRAADGTWGAETNADPGPRAGYTVLDIRSDGNAVAAYHLSVGAEAQSHVAWDVLPGFGAFNWSFVDVQTFPNEELIWPKASVSGDDILHVVAHDFTTEDNTMFYSRSTGTDYSQGFANWELVDETDGLLSLLSTTVAASPVSQKVIRACLRRPTPREEDLLTEQETNDVYIQISTDGGSTWGEFTQISDYNEVVDDVINFTHQAPIQDPEGFEYWFQASHTVEAHIDHNDIAHVLWSTVIFPVRNDTLFNPVHVGNIMHWDDTTEEVHTVFEDLYDDDGDGNHDDNPMLEEDTLDRLGAFKSSVCAPTMGSDENGNLYVTFNRFFADDYCAEVDGYGNESNGLMFNGEVFGIASTDGGVTWGSPDGMGTAVNLTDSATPDCQPGECDDDRYPTIAKLATNDGDDTYTAHLFYVNDKAPGRFTTGTNEEGPATNNPMLYLAIPAETLLPAGGNAIEDDGDQGITAKTTFLNQNSPNPFNDYTTIRYSLSTPTNVELAVYNQAGQLVKTVENGRRQAGDHRVVWDGTNDRGEAVSAGVYFYRLKTDTDMVSKRMVFVR